MGTNDWVAVAIAAAIAAAVEAAERNRKSAKS
jgi:hypothetical protein